MRNVLYKLLFILLALSPLSQVQAAEKPEDRQKRELTKTDDQTTPHKKKRNRQTPAPLTSTHGGSSDSITHETTFTIGDLPGAMHGVPLVSRPLPASSSAGSSTSVDVAMAVERTAATLFISNCMSGGASIIDIDNGALIERLLGALTSRKTLILIDSTIATPLLLLSQYKRLPIRESSSSPHGPLMSEKKAATTLFKQWQELSKKTNPHEITTLLREMKQVIYDANINPRDYNYSFFIREIAQHSLEETGSSCAAWLTFMQSNVHMDQFDWYTVSAIDHANTSTFILLAPHDLIDVSRAFPNATQLKKHAHLFDPESPVFTELLTELLKEKTTKVPVRYALDQLFAHGTHYRWNIMFHGHGSPRTLVGMSTEYFLSALDFFNENLHEQTNLVAWNTCFGGGSNTTLILDHLREKNATKPAQTVIVALNPIDAVTATSFNASFFCALDDLLYATTTALTEEKIKALWLRINATIHTPYIQVLTPNTAEFKVIQTSGEKSPSPDLPEFISILTPPQTTHDANMLLRKALEHPEGFTSRSIDVLAQIEELLDTDLLRRLILEIEASPTTINPTGVRRLLLIKACRQENIYFYTSLAEAGVEVTDINITQALAHKLNDNLDIAYRLIPHFSFEQRAYLIDWAARESLPILTIALLCNGVRQPAIAINEVLLDQLYKLSPQQLVNVLYSLNDEQKKQIEALSKKKDVPADKMGIYSLIQVYASHNRVGINEALVKFITKCTQPEMLAIISTISPEAQGKLLCHAIAHKAETLIMCLINEKAHLNNTAITTGLIDALCILSLRNPFITKQILQNLTLEQQQKTLTIVLDKLEEKQRRNSKRQTLHNEVFLIVPLVALAPLNIDRLVIDKRVVTALLDIFTPFYFPQLFPDLVHALQRMNEPQRTALDEQLVTMPELSIGSATLPANELKILLKFIKGSERAFEGELASIPAIAQLLQKLPEDLQTKALAQCSDSFKQELKKYAAENHLFTLVRQLLPYGTSWGLLIDRSLPEALLTHMHNTRHLPDACEIDVHLARAIDEASTHPLTESSSYPALHAIQAMNPSQQQQLARLAATYKLKNVKLLLETQKIPIPSSTAVSLDDKLVNAADKSLVENLSSVHQFELARLIEQKISPAELCIPLLVKGNKLTNSVTITPAMVIELSKYSQDKQRIAIIAMTRAQRTQTLRTAHLFNITSMSRFDETLPDVTTLSITPEYAQILEKNMSLTEINRLIARLSLAQKNELIQLAQQFDLSNITATTIFYDTLDTANIAITAKLAITVETTLRKTSADANKLKRLSTPQKEKLLQRALLIHAEQLLAFLKSDLNISDSALESLHITIDDQLARELNGISVALLKKILSEYLTPEQRTELFACAQRESLDNILLYLNAFDATRFSLDLIPVGIEQMTDQLTQAKIIAEASLEQKTLLAALATILDLKTVKKQLILQNIPVIELINITLTPAIERYLERSNPEAKKLACLDNHQLLLLYDHAFYQNYTNILNAFRAPTASEYMRSVLEFTEPQRKHELYGTPVPEADPDDFLTSFYEKCNRPFYDDPFGEM